MVPVAPRAWRPYSAVAESFSAHPDRYIQAILLGEAERVRTAACRSRNNNALKTAMPRISSGSWLVAACSGSKNVLDTGRADGRPGEVFGVNASVIQSGSFATGC
jgi:hypothetical protein